MTVLSVTTRDITVPLPSPIGFGGAVIDRREFAMVEIHDSHGHRGRAAAYTRGAPLSVIIRTMLANGLLGLDPEQLLAYPREWKRRNAFHDMGGGMAARALALVHLASLDLVGQQRDLPVTEIVGSSPRPIPVRVAAGYYRSEAGPNDLGDELRQLNAAGYAGVKIMAGGADVGTDLERLRMARRALPETPLAVDLAGSWAGRVADAGVLRAVEDLGIEMLEDPFPPRQVDRYADLRTQLKTPLATGESTTDASLFETLVRRDAVDVLRPDATVISTLDDWRIVLSLGQQTDSAVFPHFYPHVHQQLGTLAPTLLGVEVCPPGSGIDGLEAIAEAPAMKDGTLVWPTRPGFGVTWREDALHSLTTGVTTVSRDSARRPPPSAVRSEPRTRSGAWMD